MTPDQLAAIRERHRLTVGQYQLSPAELDRGELLAEVDRLTARLAAAEARYEHLRAGIVESWDHIGRPAPSEASAPSPATVELDE